MASNAGATAQLDRYRPALDGARALAVIAVIAYHLGIRHVPGGFLGVDLFFVLSGYLITGILLDEQSATGHISLARFWTRRVRRLLPAVVVLLAALAAYAYFSATPEENYGLRRDGLASLFYSANWWFIASGKSYFEQSADISPLRHMWSLAIEEQFYFVWPIIVMLFLRMVRGRRTLASVAIVGAVASAVALALLAGDDPSRAYYGTDSRAYELLFGALGALAIRSERWSTVLRSRRWSTVSAITLALVIVAMFTLSDSNIWYYRGGAAVFSLAATLLLIGLDVAHSPVRRLLSLRPLAAIGRISYGLYLWHWPVIVLLPTGPLQTNTRSEKALFMLLQVLVTFAIALLSYFVIERPIRNGRIGRFALTQRRTAIAFGVAMAATASLLVGATASQALPSWATKLPPGQFSVLGDTSPKAPTIAIVGDSIARSMLPGLDTAAKKAGVRVIGSAWAGCGPGVEHLLTADGKADFDYSQPCDDALPQAYAKMVKLYQPKVVYWHSVIERFPFRRADGSVVFPDTPQYEKAVQENFGKSYKALTSGGAQVLISTVVFRAQRFKGTCKRRLTDPLCGPDTGKDGVYPGINARSARFVAATKGAKLIDINPIICPGGAPCPTYVDGALLRYDGSHLTAEGSQAMGGPLLRLMLDTAGVKPLRPNQLSTRTPKATPDPKK